MNRCDAEKIITAYLKPIFGFALKRCKSIQDAEDLSQEIVLRAFRALLIKNQIGDVGRFIWTIAHNALSNYYLDSAKEMIGVSIDEMAELIADPDVDMDVESRDASVRRLQSEIAYLSKMQRKIVIAYYFENRRQADIAKELAIPLGTVKWHLFEAKKELKRGMDMTRTSSELKFNPIRFHSYGINGSVGTKSPDEFFRSILSQNICYCVRNTAKTIHEIADALGVSPVYVEPEVSFLEKYGFLLAKKDRYIVNFIISEPSAELLTMQNDMYQKAAGLFANDLYDALTTSGILDDAGIVCGQSDTPIALTGSARADHSFLLWSLIPFITACSGEHLIDQSILFEEVATVRPDGANNIFHADVIPEGMVLPDGYVYMKNWSGPMWKGNGRHIFWQIDSEWSDRNLCRGMQYSDHADRVLSLYEREEDAPLSEGEYAWLSECGYIKTWGDYTGCFKTSWQVVILENQEIKKKLLAIGDEIKAKHKAAFASLKAPYAEAMLRAVPTHLKRIKEYELQFVFQSDGWFLLHCIVTLLKNGKLKLPTKGQRKALTTIILPN